MSNAQNRIINKLLALASTSPQATRVAAGICRGNKILAMDHNTHRNKYGSEVRCSGHGEIACIHSMFPYAFRGNNTTKINRKMRKLTIYIARYKASTENISKSAPTLISL